MNEFFWKLSTKILLMPQNLLNCMLFFAHNWIGTYFNSGFCFFVHIFPIACDLFCYWLIFQNKKQLIKMIYLFQWRICDNYRSTMFRIWNRKWETISTIKEAISIDLYQNQELSRIGRINNWSSKWWHLLCLTITTVLVFLSDLQVYHY